MTGTVAVAARAGTTAGDLLDRILERPRRALATLIGLQILATVVFAAAVATHNGWVWFQGGDQIWFTSDAWALGRWTLPPGDVAAGWGIPLIPITWITGGTFVQAMPLIVGLQVLVLGPLALWCVWTVATRIGGPVLGLWSSALWIAAPYLAIPLFVQRYHERWVDQFLPQGLGLTALADYPSMVAALVVAVLVVRAIDARSWTDATLAGLVVGFAITMKPPNGLLALGAFLALLVAGRLVPATAFLLAILPGIVALAIFKERSIGELPVFGMPETHLALGGIPDIHMQRYLDFDFERWRTQMAQLREYFWSARLFQWAPIAGAVAVTRFRPAVAVLLVGWLSAFVVVKGASEVASIEANTFWRLLMPAWPAYLLLVGALPLLVPTLWRRLGDRTTKPPLRPLSRRALVVGAIGLAGIPLVLFGLTRPFDGDWLLLHTEGEAVTLVPVVDSLRPTIETEAGGVRLRWHANWRAEASYRVYRSSGHDELGCFRFGGGGTLRCQLFLDTPVVGVTRGTTWVDPAPVPDGVYRVAAAVRYDGRVVGSDVFAYSPPVATPTP